VTGLAGRAAGRAIGANLTRVPPGKAAFAFHQHHANEEYFFILSGTGVCTNEGGGARSRFPSHDATRNTAGYRDGEDGRRVRDIIAGDTSPE
jgi:uncharacterized cupin superfamily protein